MRPFSYGRTIRNPVAATRMMARARVVKRTMIGVMASLLSVFDLFDDEAGPAHVADDHAGPAANRVSVQCRRPPLLTVDSNQAARRVRVDLFEHHSGGTHPAIGSDPVRDGLVLAVD